MAVGDTNGAFDALERAQPRGANLWYAVRAVVLVVHWPWSARLERLIQEMRPH